MRYYLSIEKKQQKVKKMIILTLMVIAVVFPMVALMVVEVIDARDTKKVYEAINANRKPSKFAGAKFSTNYKAH